MSRRILQRPRHGASAVRRRSTLVLLLFTICSLLSLSSAAAALPNQLGGDPEHPPGTPEGPPGPGGELIPITVEAVYFTPGHVSDRRHPLEGVTVCGATCADTARNGKANIMVLVHRTGNYPDSPIWLRVQDRKERVLSTKVRYIGRSIVLTPACRGNIANIVGTPWADNARGTHRGDVVQLMGGNDTFSGLGGNDIVCGSDGNDRLWGNQGDDWLFGDGGDDHLGGGVGNDFLIDRGGRNLLNGGDGIDTCRGGESRTLSCERS